MDGDPSRLFGGMDTSVAPGQNFFQYANGAWSAHAEIPADRSSFGTGEELEELCTQRTADLIRSAPKTTFSLNRFQLLYKSDIYNSPGTYGIGSVTKAPFLSNMFWYDEPNSKRSIELVENRLIDFYRTIGYREDILANQILTEMVPAFINDSGHAPLLKAGHPGNPFMA